MSRPRIHLAATVLALGPMHDRLSWPERLAFMAGSVLVDGDHLVDVALQRRTGRREWCVVPLHGWEYVILLALVGRRQHWRRIAVAAALGLLLHLLIDQVTNKPAHVAGYSVLYRAWHRFAADRLPFHGGGGQWIHQPWWQWF